MLTRSSEYAIRALTQLAVLDDGRHHLARDLAEELGLPAPFLGKVLQPLVARGLLHSQRGRRGGFRLARRPDQIRLIEVVEAEETLDPADTCLLGQRECSDAAACPLHDFWTRATAAFIERLSATTLADLARFGAVHQGCAYPCPSSPAADGVHLRALGPATGEPLLSPASRPAPGDDRASGRGLVGHGPTHAVT